MLDEIVPRRFRRLSPAKLYSRKQRTWDQNWSRNEYEPQWKLTTMPSALVDAVESGWFERGSRAIDIGCGSGELAAWMADQGFDVLGVDYAQAAIDRAHREHPTDRRLLDFRAVDICDEPHDRRQFDVLIDRGCFHTIPQDFAADYVRTVSTMARPGAKFLLMVRRGNHRSPDEALDSKGRKVLDHVSEIFGPTFELCATEMMTDDPGRAMPRLVFRMERRPGPVSELSRPVKRSRGRTARPAAHSSARGPRARG